MEIERSFFDLSSQPQEAYVKEVKALVRRNDSQNVDGSPASKRPRLSQGSTGSPVTFSQDNVRDFAADGTIKSIILVNFMCHAHLQLNFNPKVNFLIGQNGSGKSAILTAITVGLGAHAKETGRGRSLKDLIRQGESTASVTINLHNKKDRRDRGISGDVITIKRTIGAASNIQIKCGSRIVSTKMDTLHSLLRDMGIQINNPISVLDQNTSKTFLAQSTPSVKYELFMKATALADIQEVHERIITNIKAIFIETDQKKKELKYRQESSKDLEKKYRVVESLVSQRKTRKDLIEELLWSKVNDFQQRITDKQNTLTIATQKMEECKSRLESKSEEESFSNEIARLDGEIREISAKKDALDKEVKSKKQDIREIISKLEEEQHDFKKAQTGLARAKKYISDYNKKIEEQEALGEPRERRMNQKQHMESLQIEISELEKRQEMKEAERAELFGLVQNLNHEQKQLRIARQELDDKRTKIERKIGMISKDESNLSIYGEGMPALISKIEASSRTFRKKPIGPLGLYVKVKDEAWALTVEAVIGGLMTAFCVDNNDDFKKLKQMMQTTLHSGQMPTIIKTRIVDQVHDTSNGAVSLKGYSNILDMLDISHPMVANLLIDKASIEKILLIPDDATCQRMLSDRRSVPRNCNYAITIKCDTYHPAPMYRTYAGKANRNVRFLKTSREAVLQSLKQEYIEAVDAVKTYDTDLRSVGEKLQRLGNQSSEVKRFCDTVSLKLQGLRTELNNLKNQEEPEETMVAALKEELRLKENEHQKYKEELAEYSKKIESLKESAKAEKQILADLEKRFNDLRAKEKEISEEKEQIEDKKNRSYQQRDSRRAALNDLIKKVEQFREEMGKYEGELEKALKEARTFDDEQRAHAEETNSEFRSKANTRRKPAEVEKRLRTIDNEIAALERDIGDAENEVVRLYDESKNRIRHIEKLLQRNEDVTLALDKAMEIRTTIYRSMLKMNRIAIDSTFRKVLRERGYQGSLDFSGSKMEIHIGLSENDSRSTSSLSGGERSFGTMALLIALWYVTKLPFYFMDEFDVFMDMANRETIMGLMMDYTRKRNYQFCFLTPLNTSTITADEDVAIHRLEPPRKQNGHA